MRDVHSERSIQAELSRVLDLSSPQNQAKVAAATAALQYVKNGMTVGLGSGSTSEIFVSLLGELVCSGSLTDITAIATSPKIDQLAGDSGITMLPFEQVSVHGFHLDIAVDGADEVERTSLGLLKGWGRAHTREKLVERRADKLVIIVDESKLVDRLGTKDHKGEPNFIPVEVSPANYPHVMTVLAAAIEGSSVSPWCEANTSEPIKTPDENYLVRLHIDGGLSDASVTAQAIESVRGVIDHGLFLNMATTVIVAGVDGVIILGEQPPVHKN